MTPSTPGTSGSASRRRRRQDRRGRRRGVRAGALAVLVLVPGGFALASLAAAPEGKPGQDPSRLGDAARVTLVADGEVLARMSPSRAERLGRGRGALPLERRRTIRRGRAVRVLATDREHVRQRLAEAAAPGAVIRVRQRIVRTRVQVPIVKQLFNNNCETAALSMLLASIGVEMDQRELQEQIATADPLDPETRPNGEIVWGDPNEGFVGRPPGGGPAGGFGVYEGPVLELARRWADPTDLSDRRPEAVYRQLAEGHAVMVWIGLSDGPYETWSTPTGDQVTVNFGEHTVVLTGIASDRLFVNDPLDGQRKVWSKDEFEAKWELLERRALSL